MTKDQVLIDIELADLLSETPPMVVVAHLNKALDDLSRRALHFGLSEYHRRFEAEGEEENRRLAAAEHSVHLFQEQSI